MLGSSPARAGSAPARDSRSQVGGADVGVAQVLEAVVIGVVVLGATFMAVSFQAPPSADQNPGSEQTQSATDSAIRSLDDLYIDDARYNHSALSRAIADAAAGDPSPLTESVNAFLPPDASFCAYLNNGERRMELTCPREPPGSAVGLSYPIEPNWRFHYAEPDLRYYDVGADTQLGLSEIPIFNAHNTRDEGDYVGVTVRGEQSWQPGLDLGSTRASFAETAYSTLLQGEDGADYPSASIYMQCLRTNGSHEPCYASDLTRGMRGYHPYASGSSGEILRFTVDNRGPGDVPDAAELQIDFPVGLDVNRPVAEPAGFTNVRVDGPDTSAAETVKADLDGSLGAGQKIHLDVEVNRTDDRYAYRHVDARLADGTVSSSQLLLRVENKTDGTWTGGDSRVAMISTPKPAGSLDSGTNPDGRWGVVVPTPYGQTTLDNLTFEMEDDQKVLRAVDFPSNFNPAAEWDVTGGNLEKIDASSFEWKKPGGQEFLAYSFAEFQFRIETNGTQTQASQRFPFAQPEANFDGYDPPPQSIQVEPGIWWREYPPEAEAGGTCGDCPGYDNDFSLSPSDPTASTEIGASLDWRGIPLEGTTNYEIADLSDLKDKGQKDALQATDLSATPRRVEPGEVVAVDIDAQDLAHYVAQTSGLTDMRLESKIYAPWGIPDREPVKTIDHGRVAGSFEAPNDMLALYVDDDSAEDVVTASTDGNVYGVHGDTGKQIAGAVFGIPESSGGNPATPNHLDHGTDGAGNHYIAVGTKAGAGNFYVIDGDLDERWRAEKPDGGVPTFAIGVGEDWTSDGVPEVLVTTEAKNVSSQVDAAFNQSRISVWDGSGDGSGQGDVIDAYHADTTAGEYGTVVTGTADQVGMGKIGVAGGDGLWVNTGPKVATNAEYVIEGTEEALKDGDVQQVVSEVNDVSVSTRGAGLFGFNDDAEKVLNLSGVRVVRGETVEAITEGSQHSGIAVGGADGWVWGLNGSAASYPVNGWDVAGLQTRTDISMGNGLDGYVVGQFPTSQESYLQATGSAFTDMYTLWWDGKDIQAVDTPEGPFRSEETAVSWWAGAGGAILTSQDRLKNVDTVGGVDVAVVAGLSVDETQGDVSLDPEWQTSTNLDMTTLEFTGVHAVDADEAWFVGHGMAGEDLNDDGVIVRTLNGGDTYQMIEVECENVSCQLTDIEHDGERLWVVGDNGTVLVRNASGMQSHVSIDGDARIDDGDRVEIPLTSDEKVEIDNVTVTWDPLTKLTYGEAATLATDTSEDRDLWNVTKGCGGLLLGSDGYTEDDTCSETWGYDRGNTLQVRDYVLDSGDGVNRTLNGSGTLTVGRFSQNAIQGYYEKSWYENTNNLPLTFHVNATFSDGTSDVYEVHINETAAINTSEVSMANWTYPDELPNAESFTTPECFGATTDSCPRLNSINVTNVGTEDEPEYAGVVAAEVTGSDDGTALYRLKAGTRTWEEVETPVYQTFNDAAINPPEPDRWIAGGEDGRVLLTYDGGDRWEPLPSDSALVNAVDFSNPVVATLVGGVGTGELYALNGYAPQGTAETKDIYDETQNDDEPIQKLGVESPPIVEANRNGATPVEIQVRDEHTGEWGTIYTSSSGAQVYNFTDATKDIQLRFKLTIDGVDKFSPMVRGDMTLAGYSQNDLGAPDLTFGFDINDTAKFDGPIDELDHDDHHGYLRLQDVRNPWLQKLGNANAGDWSAVRNGSVGARVADMAVAPNGSTIWVVTEGIYQEGAEMVAPPVQDAGCSNDPGDANPGSPLSDCLDNTLYALDASTGEREPWWDPIRFPKVPKLLDVGTEALAVATGNKTQEPTVYWMEVDDGTKDQKYTYANEWDLAPKAMVVADAFPENASKDDPITALKDFAGAEGEVSGRKAAPLDTGWMSMPSLADQFSFHYEVPEESLYGANIIVTQVRWNLTDVYSTELVQSARLHDVFEVTPDGQRMPLVPTYTLEVVAWIDDWR